MLVPPPDNWQDFERLTFSVCEAIWQYDHLERHGRHGQEQQGVDIYGLKPGKREWVGVQCKRRNPTNALGDQEIGGKLTIAEIEAEMEKAKSFKPALKHFIIATTASTDTRLQSEVRVLNSIHDSVSQFVVSIWFWEDIQSYLNQHIHVMYRYYNEVMRLSSAYDPDKQILSLFHLAFSRPAFNTYLHLENNCSDLLQAIADTQSAITTGTLKDRENGDILRSASTGANGLSEPEWRVSLASVASLLSQVRDDYTRAIIDGKVIQHGRWTEIGDHALSDHLNRMRGQVIAELNSVLLEAGLDPVESKLLERI